MGIWFWVWIWVGIALTSLAIYVLILFDLAVRAKKIQKPAKKLRALAAKLRANLDAAVQIDEIIPALDQSVAQVSKRQADRVQASRQRKEDQQRRLVKRLKDLDFDESRLS
jgi:type II secretory pathway component PulM